RSLALRVSADLGGVVVCVLVCVCVCVRVCVCIRVCVCVCVWGRVQVSVFVYFAWDRCVCVLCIVSDVCVCCVYCVCVLCACVCVLRIVCIVCEVCARVVCLRLRLSCLNIITISLHPSVFSESESESESEWDLLPSRFTPTWNFFWCEGAYSKHKNIETQISTTHKKSTTHKNQKTQYIRYKYIYTEYIKSKVESRVQNVKQECNVMKKCAM